MALIVTKSTNNRKPPTLTAETLEKLKCTECKGYLSMPPILKHPTLGSICGNCAEYNTDESYIRNTEYELIAAYLDFPCRYVRCHKRLPFKKIAEHEMLCTSLQYDCPKDNCCWSGPIYAIRTHFHEKHPNLLLETDSFDLNLTKNHTTIFLLVEDNNHFFVQYECKVFSGIFWVLMRYVGPPEKANLCKFKLYITGNKNNNIFETNVKVVQSDICLIMDKNCSLEVNINDMLKFLDCPTKLLCRIEVISL